MDVGLILTDLSLKPLALDGGAAAILNQSETPGTQQKPGSSIPKEIVEVLSKRDLANLSPAQIHFRLGGSDYLCHAFRVEPGHSLWKQPVLALHLEKTAAASDPVSDVIHKYNLTAREAEVLRGISSGLVTKDLANRLEISPNTVKAFLRLIMVKMGVTTRAELFAKILGGRVEGGRPEPAPAVRATLKPAAVHAAAAASARWA